MQTQVLARYIHKITFEDLPNKVTLMAKNLILDSLGCALGGVQTEIGEKILTLVEFLGGTAQSTIIGTDNKSTCALAAFANSEFTNALDFDDTLGGHPGCTIISPAIAMAELTNSNGKELITAIVAGYEVQTRIGSAVVWKTSFAEQSYPIEGSPWQIFGATTSAGKLLNLNETEMVQAIGIAGSAAPVPSDMKCSLNPKYNHSMVKNNYGYMSEIGIRSAVLASIGYTGPMDLLEGNAGFWRMISSDRCDFNEMTKKLGEMYNILRVEVKPYSCCRIIHPIIDAALLIMRENRLELHDLEKIEVKTSKSQTIPPKDDYEPKTATSVINSVPYSLAIALSGVTPGPAWFGKDVLTDPKIRALAKRICLIPEKLEANIWQGNYFATVKITSGNKTYQSTVNDPKGSSQNPLTQEELISKFRSLARPVIGKSNTNKLICTIQNLDQIEDITLLTKLLHRN